jgi:1-pyrroline-5-carboxylate dehydrogenase
MRWESRPNTGNTGEKGDDQMSKEALSFATVDPNQVSGASPYQLSNLVNGTWQGTAAYETIPDPLNGEAFLRVPATNREELQPFLDSIQQCSKSGLHNPFKNVERYRMYGAISAKAGQMLRDPDIADFFTRCIQRVVPKSYAQAMGEVTVTATFLENFSGDQVRFLARSFGVSGDHAGQKSNGYRWPYGPVAIISPFNFPLEIPVLQLMGALFMGNKVTIKNDSKTSVVLEQFIRMLHVCGMPLTDVDLIHSTGEVMGQLVSTEAFRSIQFTGSSRVAELLSEMTRGKVWIEDAGFDWKILGPDARESELAYVAWQCDQDAYASSGQKCSAQSILFAHQNWLDLGLVDAIKTLAARRSVEDLTVGPVLTVSTQRMIDHTEALLAIPGAKLLFGGKPLEGHSFPEPYGGFEPTAIFVPIDELLKPAYFQLATTEIFGPFQIVTSYDDDKATGPLEACERMDHHLTAAIVSNDINFIQHVLAHTVNGTTYAGIRARTTGAPQNHWFGPAGDPRGAGIGSPEAIKLVWSTHREIIEDFGPIPDGWSTPNPS